MRYVWAKGDVVLAGDEPIASAHRSWWRERAELTTTVDLPPEDAVFALWMAHLLTAREQSAATAPSGCPLVTRGCERITPRG